MIIILTYVNFNSYILANTEIMIDYGEDYIYEDHENDWI